LSFSYFSSPVNVFPLSPPSHILPFSLFAILPPVPRPSSFFSVTSPQLLLPFFEALRSCRIRAKLAAPPLFASRMFPVAFFSCPSISHYLPPLYYTAFKTASLFSLAFLPPSHKYLFLPGEWRTPPWVLTPALLPTNILIVSLFLPPQRVSSITFFLPAVFSQMLPGTPFEPARPLRFSFLGYLLPFSLFKLHPAFFVPPMPVSNAPRDSDTLPERPMFFPSFPSPDLLLPLPTIP